MTLWATVIRSIFGLVLFLSLGCAHLEPPESILPIEPRPVVVVVPGMTGSVLEDAQGQVWWGDGSSVVRPKRGGEALALPLGELPFDRHLQATEVIRELRFLGISKPIYGPLLELLEAVGYSEGRLDRPGQTDLFPFAWDWRKSHVDAAQRLHRELIELRELRGGDLPLVLICQSSGAQVCRWLARFGADDIETAEAGQAASDLDIRSLILVGPSTAGSLRSLALLHRGRSYNGLVGKLHRPEFLFSFEAPYEDLPLLAEGLFVAPDGRDLPTSLDDPQTWIDQGWSIFKTESGLRADEHPQLGNESDRRDHLVASLEKARKFQGLLASEPLGDFPPTWVFRSLDLPTPIRAAVIGDSELLLGGDSKLKKKRWADLRELLESKGDAHVPEASLEVLSKGEASALQAVVDVGGPHFEILHHPETRAAILEILEGVAATLD